jgi:hypothetical protein
MPRARVQLSRSPKKIIPIGTSSTADATFTRVIYCGDVSTPVGTTMSDSRAPSESNPD